MGHCRPGPRVRRASKAAETTGTAIGQRDRVWFRDARKDARQLDDVVAQLIQNGDPGLGLCPNGRPGNARRVGFGVPSQGIPPTYCILCERIACLSSHDFHESVHPIRFPENTGISLWIQRVLETGKTAVKQMPPRMGIQLPFKRFQFSPRRHRFAQWFVVCDILGFMEFYSSSSILATARSRASRMARRDSG